MKTLILKTLQGIVDIFTIPTMILMWISIFAMFTNETWLRLRERNRPPDKR